MNRRAALPALAASAALGAWWATPVAAAAITAAALAILRTRRLWLGCALIAAATSTLAARSWEALSVAPPPEVMGVATVLTDPDDRHGAVRAELRVGGRRYDAWARGAAAGSLRRALAGDLLDVRGATSPLRGRVAPHLRRRHVAARLQLAAAGPAAPGTPMAKLANRIRRTVEEGATVLSSRERGLFAGFVLGDDRGQDSETVERFREAGLSHLLVVSGQNVAFALILAGPLVSRGANGSRLGWTAAVLLVFGTMVRWEPSVLRAVVMAALAVSARTLSRPAARLQVLAAAVALLLLLDPLLVGSVSFLLSVSASAGIALLTPLVAARVRGPRSFVEVLSATVGAQLGVAPVLLAVFGAVPLVSVPANLLAVPVSGPLMMWGMVAGVPAGLLGGAAAAALHWPTRLMVGWVDAVAGWAVDLGAPSVGPRHALASAALIVGGLALRRAVGPRNAPLASER